MDKEDKKKLATEAIQHSFEEWAIAKSSNQNHAKFRSKAIQQVHLCINVSGVNGSCGDVSAIKFPKVLSAA
jgi:hypothetical protein